MISAAVARLAGWRGYALTSFLCFSLGFASSWKVRDWAGAEKALKEARIQTAVLQRTLAVERDAAEVSADVGARVEARTGAARTTTRRIVERVHQNVTPSADARCVVPTGFVRLHDAAVAGLPPAASSPGDSDEAASGLELSDVARTVAENYGACHEAVEMVTGWQEFYRRLQDGMGPPR